MKSFLWFIVSPMVLVPNQLIAGTVGCSIVIECQSEANPVAATNWIYKNQLLKQSPKYNIYMTESSYWTHTKLEIHDVDSNDFGVYTCLSKNSLGETEGTVRLYGEDNSFFWKQYQPIFCYIDVVIFKTLKNLRSFRMNSDFSIFFPKYRVWYCKIEYVWGDLRKGKPPPLPSN